MEKENLKFYVYNKETLNEEEKKYNKISYKRLVEYLFSDMILCNDIWKVMEQNGECLEEYLFAGTDYDGEYETCKEIYQYFIVGLNPFSYDFIQKYLKDSEDIILFYYEPLDIYVLGVDHLGTSWEYVLTDIEYTTNSEDKNTLQDNLYKSEEQE